MINVYRIRYKVDDKLHITDVSAAGAVSALNKIHFMLQIEKGAKPEDYFLTGLALVHNANASGQPLMVESPYDLPSGPNPNLKPLAPKTTETTPAMDFFNATENQGRLAD